jgi:hypothetical protein
MRTLPCFQFSLEILQDQSARSKINHLRPLCSGTFSTSQTPLIFITSEQKPSRGRSSEFIWLGGD